MDTPTATTVREWAGDSVAGGFSFASVGYPAPTSGPDRLDRVVSAAVGYVEQVTGRVLATMPASLVSLAEDAILMRTQQRAGSGSGSVMRRVVLGSDLKSFRAGDYQETRRDLSELVKAKAVNEWPALNEVLWLLMTDEKRAEWRAQVLGQAEAGRFIVEQDAGAADVYGYDVTGFPYGYAD